MAKIDVMTILSLVQAGKIINQMILAYGRGELTEEEIEARWPDVVVKVEAAGQVLASSIANYRARNTQNDQTKA